MTSHGESALKKAHTARRKARNYRGSRFTLVITNWGNESAPVRHNPLQETSINPFTGMLMTQSPSMRCLKSLTSSSYLTRHLTRNQASSTCSFGGQPQTIYCKKHSDDYSKLSHFFISQIYSISYVWGCFRPWEHSNQSSLHAVLALQGVANLLCN